MAFRPLLTIHDVAEQLQVSVSTVRRLVREERFPQPVRVGRLLRWRQQDLEEFFKLQSERIDEDQPTSWYDSLTS